MTPDNIIPQTAAQTYAQNISMPAAAPQNNGETEKEKRLREYRSRLDRLIATLTVKYNLPPLTGAAKQIPWANDIRIKFIDTFDKKINTLTPEEIHAVYTHILPQNTSRWWIDRKDAAHTELIIYAKTINSITAQTQIQTPQTLQAQPYRQIQTPQTLQAQPYQQIQTNPALPEKYTPAEPPAQNTAEQNLITIDTRDSKTIKIHTQNPETIRSIMEQNGFHKEENIWTKHQPKTDEKRTPMIETICLTLLAEGHIAKVLTAPTPEPPHEGCIKLIDGKLCIDTKTTHLWKAASQIGTKRIWLETARKEEIQTLIRNFDIICTKEAEQHLKEMETA